MLKRLIVGWLLPPRIFGLLRSVGALVRNFLRVGPGRLPDELQTFTNIDDLVAHHFLRLGAVNHVNRAGLTLALRCLNEKPALIVETGTSAWGTDSTRLFASYVRSFGGLVISVDIRPEASKNLTDVYDLVRFEVNDSVRFLKNLILPTDFQKIDFLYLDSWDLDLTNPVLSMEHGLAEWESAQRFLGAGSVVAIDDTPIESCLFGEAAVTIQTGAVLVPGKGALVLQDADAIRAFDVKYHHYNLVLVKR